MPHPSQLTVSMHPLNMKTAGHFRKTRLLLLWIGQHPFRIATFHKAYIAEEPGNAGGESATPM